MARIGNRKGYRGLIGMFQALESHASSLTPSFPFPPARGREVRGNYRGSVDTLQIPDVIGGVGPHVLAIEHVKRTQPL